MTKAFIKRDKEGDKVREIESEREIREKKSVCVCVRERKEGRGRKESRNCKNQ